MTYEGETELEGKLIALQRYTRELLATESRSETAHVAVEAAHEVLGAPLVGFHDYNPETATLGTLASVDMVREELGTEPTYRRTGDDRVAQLVWGIFETGDPVHIDDLSTYDRGAAAKTPAASGILHPLGDRGIFIISATTAGEFDQTDYVLVGILVETLEAALDRVDRERLLQERTQQLRRENDRLEEFAGVVSHDLQTPLSVVSGRIELAREAADEPVEEHLKEAASALDRTLALIDDLLALARDGRLVEEPEPVALDVVATAAWEQVNTDGARLDLCVDGVTLAADKSRLTELLENLFRNCIEHGATSSTAPQDDVEERTLSSQGRPDEKTAGDETTPTVTVTVGPLEDGFYVADDGPGIPPEERERVFDGGYTTNESGTGFGLRIVRDIASGHGWSIRATESESGGARFEVCGVDRAP